MRDVSKVFDYGETPREHFPERVLFLGILERALWDATGNDKNARREARAWFEAKDNLLPYAVGWQDILDLGYLSAPRIALIEDMLKNNYRCAA